MLCKGRRALHRAELQVSCCLRARGWYWLGNNEICIKVPSAWIWDFSPILQRVGGCLEQMLSMCWPLSPPTLGGVSPSKAKH